MQQSNIFLVTNATLISDNPLHFRKNFLERISNLIMTIDNKIIDGKLQYGINRKAPKIDIFAAFLLISNCSFSSLILSSIVLISFNFVSKRFFLKHKALSSNKIGKSNYLTGEEILSADLSRMRNQAKLTCALLGKPLNKQSKTIENQGRKLKLWKF